MKVLTSSSIRPNSYFKRLSRDGKCGNVVLSMCSIQTSWLVDPFVLGDVVAMEDELATDCGWERARR